MKHKNIKGLFSAFIAVAIILMMAIPASAATFLDNNKTVSFTMNCNKPGYTFNVYKVATLSSNSANPYETKYTSLIPTATSAEVTTAIQNGKTADLLSALDSIENMPSEVATFGPTSETVTTKTLSGLQQGVYYVRAVNYPAGVQSVTNSVFALPYYPDNETGWTYELDDIELATKVFDKDITTEKTITNSTKNNVNYTDVGLGDTVDFSIKSDTAGSMDFRLNSYLIYDDMSAGLTLDKNSFNVALLNKNEEKITDLDPGEYTVTITSEGEGKNTTFNVALTKEYLQQTEFYADEVCYTDVTYSATLNKYAIVGVAGNPNEEVKIQYSNKNGVTDEVEGNTVYVYTYAVTTNKLNPEGIALANAEFKLYETEANANSLTSEIATGVSDENGKVTYYNSKGEEIRLASGTYYIVETKAPEGYNLYGKVIEVTIDAEYGDTFVNGTYVLNCPEDGYAEFDVTDTQIILPQTGGFGTNFFYIIGIVLFVGGVAVFSRIKKLSKSISE